MYHHKVFIMYYLLSELPMTNVKTRNKDCTQLFNANSSLKKQSDPSDGSVKIHTGWPLNH